MAILSIDTTMNGCSVGLYHTETGLLAEESLEMSRGQAEQLMPMIETVLERAELKYDGIDHIAVTKGPGAFTGMRIGLATAKSLALALDIPVTGVCTFQAVLRSYLDRDSARTSPYFGVLLETKRQDFYFQMFRGKNPCSDKVSAAAAEIICMIDGQECLMIGDVAERFKAEIGRMDNLLFESLLMPSSVAITKVALESEGQGLCDPVYVRPPDVGRPKNPPRKIRQ